MSMVVPVYNGIAHIDGFFNSLEKENTDIEVLFVDNGSEDGSFEYLKKLCESNQNFQVLKYIEKQSSYAARNYGVSKSLGKVLLFTDIDCILTSDYYNHVRKIELNEESFITGPTDIFFDKYNIYEYFDKCTYLTQESYSKQNYAATANLVVGKSLFENVGGFPEFTSGADNKFCKMCIEIGNKLEFQKDLKILHSPRSTLKEHLLKAKRLGIGHGEVFLDNNLTSINLAFIIVKQFILLLLPIHSLRLFIRVFKNKKCNVVDLLKLFYLSFVVVSIQRIEITKKLMKIN